MLACLYTHVLTKANNTSLTQLLGRAQGRDGNAACTRHRTRWLQRSKDTQRQQGYLAVAQRTLWVGYFALWGCSVHRSWFGSTITSAWAPKVSPDVARGWAVGGQTALGRERCTEAMCLHVSDLQPRAGGGQRALPNSQAPS